MRNRICKTILALTAVTAFAVPAGAQAKNGADDAAGHVRHSSHSSTQARHHSRSSSRARHHSHARHHARHGADDGPNHR
jgi:Ni/Co efflux regulator RcnB